MLPSDMMFKSHKQVIEGYVDKIDMSKSGLELGKQESGSETSHH